MENAAFSLHDIAKITYACFMMLRYPVTLFLCAVTIACSGCASTDVTTTRSDAHLILDSFLASIGLSDTAPKLPDNIAAQHK